MKACLGLAGAAQLGENRYARQWLDRFQAGMDVYARHLVDPKGVHRETIQYLGFGFNPCTLAALAAERRGQSSLFASHGGRVNDLLRSIVYMTSPNGQNTRDFGDTGGRDPITMVRSHRGMPGNVATMLIAMTNSSRPGLARWAARRALHRLNSGYKTVNYTQGARVLNVLLFRPGAEKPPAEYDGFPLGWHERCPIDYPKDSGYAVMQTGFDSPDDIKLVLKCGHAAGGHGHPCQGTFTLDAYGDYLSKPPGYTLWGRAHTRAYNLITIDGKGQVADHTAGSGRDSNDGHIERFVHTPGADLCIANNKPAYDGPSMNGRWSNPVRRSLRYILFVRKPNRRGYFVFIDDVAKDEAEHEYTWNFHTTANHRIHQTAEQRFTVQAKGMKEALDLWKSRGKDNALRKLISTVPVPLISFAGLWHLSAAVLLTGSAPQHIAQMILPIGILFLA